MSVCGLESIYLLTVAFFQNFFEQSLIFTVNSFLKMKTLNSFLAWICEILNIENTNIEANANQLGVYEMHCSNNAANLIRQRLVQRFGSIHVHVDV